tara:strand:+ start:324 stop:539 length:216 start_codon:yes stop_codon:yes gene_type:complete
MDETNTSKDENKEKSINKGILAYDNDNKQVLFRLFGVEMTAPTGLKNPRIVYISFIVINLFLLIFLKNLIN